MDAHLVAQLRTLMSASDDEVCGALLGEKSRISEVQPLPNRSLYARTSFLIPAAEVLLAERQAQRRGLELIGFYHSHTNGSAVPSSADLEQAVPGYIYAIVGQSGDVRFWCLRPDRTAFDEVV